MEVSCAIWSEGSEAVWWVWISDFCKSWIDVGTKWLGTRKVD